MALIEKLKRLFGYGSPELAAPGPGRLEEELPEQERRLRAMRVRAMVDKWEASPYGPMASVPKVARAFAFYMRAPVLFRCYCTPQGGMQKMLKEHGIEVHDAALSDPELMLPFWKTLEGQLPSGPSAHEQWAARFYGA